MALRIQPRLLRFIATPTVDRSCIVLGTRIPYSPSHGRQLSAESSKSRPLYPSVAVLLHENNISTSDAAGIPASGPGGRLLKGDVLAYLGRIQATYPSESADRIKKLGQLDLTNIQLAEPVPIPSESLSSATADLDVKHHDRLPEPTNIRMKLDLQPVFSLQDRIASTLGIDLEVDTLLGRASALANHDLPAPARQAQRMTDDQLFDSVLGIRGSRAGSTNHTGKFVAVLEDPLMPASATTTARRPEAESTDLFDQILGIPPSKRAMAGRGPRWSAGSEVASSLGPTESYLSTLAPSGEDKRALAFLNRVKTVLETEPGSLVL